MEPGRTPASDIASREVLEQAARWAAELEAPERDAKLLAQFGVWAAADASHAAAFAYALRLHRGTHNLPYAPSDHGMPPRSARQKLASRAKRVSTPALACVVLAIAALTAAFYLAHDGTFTTGANERRTTQLSDGTRVSLNANSRMQVEYDDRTRKVRLTRGEALFDVTKHQPRPFVVVIGDRKVVAVGTSFMVRREELDGVSNAEPAFDVILMEGRVAIEPITWPDALPGELAPQAKLLRPGERLRFRGDGPGTVDMPSLEKVTAWQRGLLIFDDTSLSEAVAEFNRYGSTLIRIDSPTAGSLRVGGVFKIDDPSAFAHAMASTYHLQFVNSGGRIILTSQSSK